jgi:hypothetical protein
MTTVIQPGGVRESTRERLSAAQDARERSDQYEFDIDPEKGPRGFKAKYVGNNEYITSQDVQNEIVRHNKDNSFEKRFDVRCECLLELFNPFRCEEIHLPNNIYSFD